MINRGVFVETLPASGTLLMAGKQLRIVGIIALVVVGLLALGTIQGMILEYDVIAASTSSPDPATALGIAATVGLLFCVVVVTIIVMVCRRRK